MGIFAMNQEGIQGAIFQMLSHGLVSGALFLCVGVVYDRMHTREIAAYGGLVNNMPKYAVVFMIFTMANVGLPGTSGFIGEFLTLLGIFKVNTWVALFAASGVILSAAYALWLYRKVIFGALTKESLKGLLDLSVAREGDHLSAGDPRHFLRRLSGSGVRCDIGIGRVAGQQHHRIARCCAERGGELTRPDHGSFNEPFAGDTGIDHRGRRHGALDARRLFQRAHEHHDQRACRRAPAGRRRLDAAQSAGRRRF